MFSVLPGRDGGQREAGRVLIIGTMLMLSGARRRSSRRPRPLRMPSAAICCTADRPEGRKRLTVMPPTLLGEPARMAPTRATLRPCWASGWRSHRITSSTRVEPRCLSHGARGQTGHRGGGYGSNRVPLPVRGARGRIDVGVTMRGHDRVLRSSSVAQRLAGGEHGHDALPAFGVGRAAAMKARRSTSW